MKHLYTVLILLSTFNAICQDKAFINPIVDTIIASNIKSSYLLSEKIELKPFKKGDFFDSRKLLRATLINDSNVLQPFSYYQINPYKKNLNTLLAYYSLAHSTNQTTSVSSSTLINRLAEVKQINLHEIPMDQLQKEAAMHSKLERDKQQMELYKKGRDLNLRTFEVFKIESRNARKKK
jgi:hypothetical protein